MQLVTGEGWGEDREIRSVQSLPNHSTRWYATVISDTLYNYNCGGLDLYIVLSSTSPTV